MNRNFLACLLLLGLVSGCSQPKQMPTSSAADPELSRDPVTCCTEAKTLLSSSSGAGGPLRLGTAKQLFLDNLVVARLENVKRKLHQPTKMGAVIRPDKPWDGDWVQIRTAPSWHPEKKLWMLWYFAGNGTGYATSSDGIHWEKPALGVREFKGSKQNNLLPQGYGDEQDSSWSSFCFVFYDAREPDPQRRYKALASRLAPPRNHPPQTQFQSGFYPATSADGLHWSTRTTSLIPSSDEAHLFYDTNRGIYAATVKHMGPYGRSVYLSLSRDFEHWSDPRDCLIFHADKHDQETGARRIASHVSNPDMVKLVTNRPAEYRTDVYALPVFRYESVYIGLPTLFHQSGAWHLDFRNQDGILVVEVAASRDLLNWERVGNREMFLSPSPVQEGVYDNGELLASNAPIIRNNELWFYYSGLKSRSNPVADDGAICLAKLRLDGFVSLDAGEQAGSMVTRPLVIDGKTLHLNVDAPGGEVRTEVLDATSQDVLPGFSQSDSVPLSKDSVDVESRWNQANLSSLKGKTVRLRFVFRKARLYSFWTSGP